MTQTKRVVVFGGTGFLGRRLIGRLLARDISVTIASRHSSSDANGGESRPLQIDIRDKGALTQDLESD